MISVVDASSVVAYLLGEGNEHERAALMGEAHAPSLLDIEVTHTLRGLVRGHSLGLMVAEQGRTELADLAVRRHPDLSLLRRAWELRDTCTIYDALYVALAEALDARLITRDARLARSVGKLVDCAVC